MRLCVVLTHPVQYISPWFANLARHVDLSVFYGFKQTPEGQARAGFEVPFEWDIPLFEGYSHRFLDNVARKPGSDHFFGCDNPSIKDEIEAGRFDAVFTYGWNRKCYWQAILAARARGVPVLIRSDTQLETPRGLALRMAKSFGYRAVLPRLGDYLYPGERTVAYLHHYGVTDERMHHFPHMVDNVRIAAAASEARDSGKSAMLRSEAGAGQGDIVFLFVGKLIPKKRPDRLLHAFGRFMKGAGEAARRCQLWLVGDGPLRAELEAYAAVNELPVRFCGFVNQANLPAYYAAADCLVLPSDAGETWGLVVNEAFAAGIPAIVSSEAGCSATLIEQGRTGWVYDGGEEALAVTLAEAAAQIDGISDAAIAKMNAQHSLDAGTERMMEIVEHVNQRNGRVTDAKTVKHALGH